MDELKKDRDIDAGRLTQFKLPDQELSSLPTGNVKNMVEELGKRITRGDYLPGGEFPHESDLISEFTVSRTTVREAIKVLSGKGLLRTARRYGTRVNQFDEWNFLDPEVISWHASDGPLTQRIYREAIELRCLIEPEAAALAALNANDEQRALINRSAFMIRPEPYGTEAMMAADYTFHATILDSTGRIMLKQLKGLILAILRFSYKAGALAAPDEKVSQHNHVRVAQAISQQDQNQARQLMSEMLKQNRIIARKLESANG